MHWGIVAAAGLLLIPSVCAADVGCDFSTATCVYSGTGTPVVMSVPDGSGDAFTAVRLRENGLAVDASIVVSLVDCSGNPVVDYPAEDMWLGTADGGFVPCVSGAIADRNSDVNGQTVFEQPLHAGGFSTDPCQVFVLGAPLASSDLRVAFVSPDVNGDLSVDVMDVALFAARYFGAYAFEIDFYADGIINLSDLSVLARAVGRNCS